MVIFHAFQWLDDQFWVGAAGVDVFFVISGFIIWTVTDRASVSPLSFVWRRLTRVAPAYWVMTFVMAAIALADPLFLPQVAVTPSHLLLSLAFIQHADPHGLVFPLLPPGWTLNYEALFYLIFAGALFAPRAARFAVLLVALVLVVLAGFAFPPAYGYIANPMMLQFAVGAWLARGPLVPWLARIGAGPFLAAVGVLALAVMGFTGFRDELWRPALWGFPAAMIVAGLLALERQGAPAPPKLLLRLGDASYAIYLCHLPATALVAHTLGVRPALVFAPLAAVASIAAGLVFHRAVERPLIAVARTAPAFLRRR